MRPYLRMKMMMMGHGMVGTSRNSRIYSKTHSENMVKAKTKEPPEVITIIDDSEDSSSASEDFEGTNYLQDSEADMEDSAEETEDSSDFEDFGGDREEPYDNCLSFALSGKSSGACKIVPGKTSCVRCIKTRKLCTRLEVPPIYALSVALFVRQRRMEYPEQSDFLKDLRTTVKKLRSCVNAGPSSL
ncbi:hypothetical protein VTJ04DRAFT_1858 [Mycothermus thermophilus]|uniref:uncharacterized protein n=1 Tax=Humicola insolens TaxID=85995 RepID=UPI003742D795